MLSDQSFNVSKDTAEIKNQSKTLNCFICDNEYALKRIENHIFICEQKWEAE